MQGAASLPTSFNQFGDEIAYCPGKGGNGCGREMRVGESKTDKNYGKKFFSCNNRKGGCGFFQWYDIADDAAQKEQFAANANKRKENAGTTGGQTYPAPAKRIAAAPTYVQPSVSLADFSRLEGKVDKLYAAIQALLEGMDGSGGENTQAV